MIKYCINLFFLAYSSICSLFFFRNKIDLKKDFTEKPPTSITINQEQTNQNVFVPIDLKAQIIRNINPKECSTAKCWAFIYVIDRMVYQKSQEKNDENKLSSYPEKQYQEDIARFAEAIGNNIEHTLDVGIPSAYISVQRLSKKTLEILKITMRRSWLMLKSDSISITENCLPYLIGKDEFKGNTIHLLASKYYKNLKQKPFVDDTVAIKSDRSFKSGLKLLSNDVNVVDEHGNKWARYGFIYKRLSENYYFIWPMINCDYIDINILLWCAFEVFIHKALSNPFIENECLSKTKKYLPEFEYVDRLTKTCNRYTCHLVTLNNLRAKFGLQQI